jgi:hypothetical protein
MHRQIYNLDRLIEYGTEAIPDITRVINPAWRHLDSQIRRQNGLLSRELLQFAEIQLPQEMEPKEVEAYERKERPTAAGHRRTPPTNRPTQGST